MKWLKSSFDLIWPHSDEEPENRRDIEKQKKTESIEHIRKWQTVSKEEDSLYLDEARRIFEEEMQRKSTADMRATTFIAAIATLIPLMTWALGSSPPACESGLPCILWSGIFTLAVIYLALAAVWSLRTLAVANYFVIGVEDLVRMNRESKGKSIIELIKKNLIAAQKNNNTINEKLTKIKIAQHFFVNGIVVLACLLATDPWMRLTLSPVKTQSSITPQSSPPSLCPPATSEPTGQSLDLLDSPALLVR